MFSSWSPVHRGNRRLPPRPALRGGSLHRLPLSLVGRAVVEHGACRQAAVGYGDRQDQRSLEQVRSLKRSSRGQTMQFEGDDAKRLPAAMSARLAWTSRLGVSSRQLFLGLQRRWRLPPLGSLRLGCGPELGRAHASTVYPRFELTWFAPGWRQTVATPIEIYLSRQYSQYILHAAVSPSTGQGTTQGDHSKQRADERRARVAMPGRSGMSLPGLHRTSLAAPIDSSSRQPSLFRTRSVVPSYPSPVLAR